MSPIFLSVSVVPLRFLHGNRKGKSQRKTERVIDAWQQCKQIVATGRAVVGGKVIPFFRTR